MTYPEIVDYMQERLMFYTKHQLLLTRENEISCEAVEGDQGVWLPYQSYDEAIDAFETQLYEDYLEKYEMKNISIIKTISSIGVRSRPVSS